MVHCGNAIACNRIDAPCNEKRVVTRQLGGDMMSTSAALASWYSNKAKQAKSTKQDANAAQLCCCSNAGKSSCLQAWCWTQEHAIVVLACYTMYAVSGICPTNRACNKTCNTSTSILSSARRSQAQSTLTMRQEECAPVANHCAPTGDVTGKGASLVSPCACSFKRATLSYGMCSWSAQCVRSLCQANGGKV